MSNVTKKTTSRLAAVQAIFQYEINSKEQSISDIIDSLLEFYENKATLEDFDEDLDKPIKLNLNFFRELVLYIVNNLAEIDQVIEKYLSEGWSLDKIDLSLLSVLRAGVCELKYFQETPYKVVINEFTNIASDLLKEKDVGFVNSLLDGARKELRSQE
ncbi:MAG: nusB [Rickettsiaceae bacterium]|jgi:N utilization substance protein B|nr:nusB [Rickettsiaceae bacterium]